MDEKIINLLQQEIDGTNSAAESRYVKKLCLRDPEVARRYKELELTSRALEGLGYIEPPLSLETDILRTIDPEKYSIKKNPVRIVFDWLNKFSRERYPVPAFAAGLIAGAVILFLVHPDRKTPRHTDYTQFQGTLSQKNLSQAAGERHIISAGDLTDVCGQIELQNTPRSAVITIHISSDAPVEILLSPHKDHLQFKSMHVEKSDSSPDLSLRANSINLIHDGEQIYIVSFYKKAAGPSLLNCKIKRDNVLKWQKVLSIDP